MFGMSLLLAGLLRRVPGPCVIVGWEALVIPWDLSSAVSHVGLQLESFN